MRYLIAALVISVSTVRAEGVKLVGPDTVKFGRSVILKVPIEEAGKEFDWKVAPASVQWTSGENRSETFVILLDVEENTFVSFASFDGKKHDAKVIVVDGKPKPPGPVDPDVDPNIDPKPSAKKLFVVIWFDPETKTPAHQQTMSEVMKWAVSTGKHTVFSHTVNDQEDERTGLKPFIDRVGKLPVVTVQDDETGKVLGGFTLPPSAKILQDEILKYEAK